MNIKRLINVSLIISSLTLISYFILTYDEVKLKTVKLSKKNTVTNLTKNKYIDTVLSVGLDILKKEGVYVIVRELETTKKPLGQDYHLKGQIVGKDNQYTILVENTSIDETIDILSHELIHLKQLKDNRLIIVNNNLIFYEKQEYVLSDFEYMSRPWEVDAINQGQKLSNEIKKILYIK